MPLAAREVCAASLVALTASVLTTLCWLRRPPPWMLAPWMAPEVRRAAVDYWSCRREVAVRDKRKPLILYFIRHGQSAANVAPHLIGGRDVQTKLTEKGEAQAVQVGRRLAREGLVFDRVLASHAVRARRTAELACAELGFPLEEIEIEPRVVEFSQGGLEKRPREEVYVPGGPTMCGIRRQSMFFRPPGFSPDGDRGESQYDAEMRVRDFVEELQGAQTSAQTVAVFSHGIAIRAFVRGIVGADTAFTMHTETANTSVTVLEYRPSDAPTSSATDLGGWVLRCLNDQTSPPDRAALAPSIVAKP